MKKHLLLLSLVILIVSVSCKDDEKDAVPPHEIGQWNLGGYATVNVPADYASREGATYDLGDINLGIESYKFTLQSKVNFERSIQFTGTLPQDDKGEYTIDEDYLTFKPEDGNEDEYNIEKNENDQLWLSIPINFLLIKDAVLDTLTEEYVNSISEEEFDDLFDPVSLDLVLLFEKED